LRFPLAGRNALAKRISLFRLSFMVNRMVWIGIAPELALVSLILYVPGLQGVFGVAPFPLGNWLFLFALAPLLLLADEARKALNAHRFRPKPLPKP